MQLGRLFNWFVCTYRHNRHTYIHFSTIKLVTRAVYTRSPVAIYDYCCFVCATIECSRASSFVFAAWAHCRSHSLFLLFSRCDAIGQIGRGVLEFIVAVCTRHNKLYLIQVCIYTFLVRLDSEILEDISIVVCSIVV